MSARVAPALVIGVQSYSGEAPRRVHLFALPAVTPLAGSHSAAPSYPAQLDARRGPGYVILSGSQERFARYFGFGGPRSYGAPPDALLGSHTFTLPHHAGDVYVFRLHARARRR